MERNPGRRSSYNYGGTGNRSFHGSGAAEHPIDGHLHSCCTGEFPNIGTGYPDGNVKVDVFPRAFREEYLSGCVDGTFAALR